MDAAEKAQIASEMVTASLVTTGQMFLRLGLATVIVVGNTLMINHQTTLFSYILFLIAASRLYDPLSGAMANMAELFSVDLQVKCMKEIQDYKEENKKKEYGCKFSGWFLRCERWKITLGGTDIAPIDSVAMMKDFSVVFQNVVLFNNTVMENIRIGRKDATDEDVPLTEVLLQRAEHMMN